MKSLPLTRHVEAMTPEGMTARRWTADVYEPFATAIAGYLARRTEISRVEDLVSETFLTAWRRREDAPSESALRPWLFVIARNLLTNQRRRDATTERTRSLLLLVRGVPEDFDDMLIAQDRNAEVALLVNQLAPLDAELLTLSMWDELDRHEIGVILDMTPAVVSVRLHRARARFALLVETSEYFSPAVTSCGAARHVGSGTATDPSPEGQNA